MVQYRYARNANGDHVVDAAVLSKFPRSDDWEFICLGCNRPLIAKVHGQQKAPHFAHSVEMTCSDETYLHFLGKKVFAEEFKKCRESGATFEIELRYPLFCRKFEDEVGGPCRINEWQVKTHNLAAFFNEIEEERRDGTFVPDLLLRDTDRTQMKVYIEIAVTHFLSEKKERSAERIIEIPIDCEEDIAKIRSRRLTTKDCRFLNFNAPGQSVTDSKCACEDRLAYALIVWDSGKTILEKLTLGEIVAKRRKNQERIAYFRLIEVERPGKHLPPPRDVFRSAILKARDEGFPIRNCYLCCYQGDNFNGDPNKPVYCKCFKKRCGSNEAVGCKAFKLKQDSSFQFPIV